MGHGPWAMSHGPWAMGPGPTGRQPQPCGTRLVGRPAWLARATVPTLACWVSLVWDPPGPPQNSILVPHRLQFSKDLDRYSGAFGHWCSFLIDSFFWLFWIHDIRIFNISLNVWKNGPGHQRGYSKVMKIFFVCWLFWSHDTRIINISLDVWKKWTGTPMEHSKNMQIPCVCWSSQTLLLIFH